jgi:hypothetical protein
MWRMTHSQRGRSLATDAMGSHITQRHPRVMTCASEVVGLPVVKAAGRIQAVLGDMAVTEADETKTNEVCQNLAASWLRRQRAGRGRHLGLLLAGDQLPLFIDLLAGGRGSTGRFHEGGAGRATITALLSGYRGSGLEGRFAFALGRRWSLRAVE